ncbi:MAG: ABC transporter ATP-binding protein [Gemmataceae bacterium]
MALKVLNLSKSYQTRSGTLPVLNGVSLSLDAGQAVALTGPSGSGKSTLLHILGTLDRPSEGTVELDGQNPFQLNDSALASFRNTRVGFVFQDHHLLPQCTVLENVLIPTMVTPGRDSLKLEVKARGLLKSVGLGERLEHRPAELSGGERQRAAVARALINSPHLILADEPTGNLDRKSAAAVGDLLLDLAKNENVILITVTHSSELASRFPTRFEMDDGRLVK